MYFEKFLKQLTSPFLVMLLTFFTRRALKGDSTRTQGHLSTRALEGHLSTLAFKALGLLGHLSTWGTHVLKKHIHNGERNCCNCYFWRFVSCFFSDRVKKTFNIPWSALVFFAFLEKRKPNRNLPLEVNLLSYM